MAAPSTIQSSFNKMTGDNTQGSEITYGRYIFKGGKIFDFTGKEISRKKAGLTVGEVGALEESKQAPMQFSLGAGGGGGASGVGGATGGYTGAGPRIGGTSVNISDSGGGSGARITNPLIRQEAQRMEFANWLYGGDPNYAATQAIASDIQRAQARGEQLGQAVSSLPSYAQKDPTALGEIWGRASQGWDTDSKRFQGGSIISQYGRGSQQFGNFLAGLRATNDPALKYF